MKKTILTALAAITMMLTISCNKFDIPGTRWQGTAAGQVSMGGFDATIGSHDTLTFTSETAGNLVQRPFSEAFGMVTDGESTTTNFTYTFDGSEGTITFNQKRHPFSYNSKRKELTLQIITPGEEGYDEYIQTFSKPEVSFKMY